MLDITTATYATATADTASIVLAAPAKPSRWSIGGIAWSYEGGTLSTAAGIVIHNGTDSAATVFSVDINDDGAGFIIPSEPVKFLAGRAVTINLRNGGASVVGKINLIGAKLV